MSAADARATLLPMQQPTMFAHDGITIFYPTAPGRVYLIAIAALADCDGSDEDYSDSTLRGDCYDMACHGLFALDGRTAPQEWPSVYIEDDLGVGECPDLQATTDDFRDCLEQWADWCDRDSAWLDSLDGVMAAVAAA